MPKAWSDREKELVKASLRDEGKKLFEKYGLQKTIVDDIVRAARISKGAFYLFYKTKEELFFDILEVMEKDFRDKIYGVFARTDMPRREIFRSFLASAMDVFAATPLYNQLNAENYEYLFRKLPEDTVKKHVRSDFGELAKVFLPWMEKGWMRKVDMGALAGLLLSLIYFIMHRDDIGVVDNDAAMELWIDMLTEYLIPEEKE